MGGFYCPRCGVTRKQLPVGVVSCHACGSYGLRGYDNAKPKRKPCPIDGCARVVWDDGGVTPGTLQHKWEHV